MKKFLVLAMVAAISAFALSCDKDNDGDDIRYDWTYQLVIEKSGGMSAEDLAQLNAAFDIVESQSEFEATLEEARAVFEASIESLIATLKTNVSVIPHTSEIRIVITCSSAVDSFQRVVIIP